MTPQEFCYWLQGFFELADPQRLTEKQVQVIEQHLDLVDVTVNGIPSASSGVAKSVGDVKLRC